MTTRDALEEAIRLENVDDAMSVLFGHGVWMADEDAMSQAVHRVYCGITPDHEGPNDKDREQARQLIAAISQSVTDRDW